METRLAHLTVILVIAWPRAVFAGGGEKDTLWVTNLRNSVENGWVITVPTASSDWFSEGYEIEPGMGDSETLVRSLPIVAISVSVADFGSGSTFPRLGVYPPNLALDASGCTPDLTRPLIELFSPPNPAPALFEFVAFHTPPAALPIGTTRVFAAVQLPPDDPGLLSVGADSNTAAGCSGFSMDGYASPAVIASFIDWGINIGQDNLSNNTNLAPPNSGRLRVQKRPVPPGELTADPARGDHLTLDGARQIQAGDTIEIAFFGPHRGASKDLWQLEWLDPMTGVWGAFPPVGGAWLDTSNDSDGGGCWARIEAIWPTLSPGEHKFRARFRHLFFNHGLTNTVSVWQ